MADTTQHAQGIEDRLVRLEQELLWHRDRAAIEAVLVRYSRALDWLDESLLDTVFHPDAQVDYGFFKGSIREFRPLLMQVERAAGRRWHFTAQISIKLHDERANVESYNLSMTAEPVTSTPPADLQQFFGYYVDKMEKRDGRWGIVFRKHLLVAATQVREVAIEGPLAVLNQIGPTSPDHSDYRRLTP